jgi:hypothetical protein
MLDRALQAPPARLALVFHAPTIARLEVVYQPVWGRLVRAFLGWLLCWGVLPILVWVPPHYPWVLAAFVAGIYLPIRIWNGKYLVRSFAGFCPRCGRSLELGRGSKINLPHTLTCFGCHFEPVLEVATVHTKDCTDGQPGASVAAPVRIEHRMPECTGSWNLQRGHAPAAVACDACGARHCATPAARRAAEDENHRGTLLTDLTAEGRFLL